MHRSLRSQQEIDQCFRRLLPNKGWTRLLSFLPLAVVGLMESGSCHLNDIAAAMSFRGRLKSHLQRLSRWIGRPSFRVAQLLPEVARGFVASCALDPLPLLVDRTEWKHANLLVAAVPFRGRAIPVAIMIFSIRKTTNHTELDQLLSMADRALPEDANVVVIGDREFGDIPAIRAIQSRGWHFCLRFKNDTWLESEDGAKWQARDEFPPPGKSVFWRQVKVTWRRHGPLSVAVHWHKRNDEPWILVSDLPAEKLRRLYKKRMCIEEMFSDLKSRGFDLEATRLRKPDRILRLAALLCLTYIWMLVIATKAIRRGLRKHADPAGQRALSLYKIARRIIGPLHELAPPLITAAARVVCPK